MMYLLQKSVPIALVAALAGCQSFPRLPGHDTVMECGRRAPEPACVIEVAVNRGRIEFKPDVLHVHFGGSDQPVLITWKLADASVKDGWSFRRGTSVIFRNLDPDQDTFSVEQPANDADRIGRTPGVFQVRTLDQCGKTCDGEYGYLVVVYDYRGKVLLSTDPIIKNHPT